MERGLGRCVLELDRTENVEKYRDTVLWGCTHNLSFDTQCEGTRAWYLYELIKRFPYAEEFVSAVINRFDGCKSDGRWEFAHYCDLLALFAADGNADALNALRKKYAVLYDVLLNRKRLPANGIFAAQDDFEYLCIALADCSDNSLAAYLKIANDIGTLYQSNNLYSGGDFVWLRECCVQNYGKLRVQNVLESAAEKFPAVRKYIDETTWCNAEYEVRSERRNIQTPHTADEFYTALSGGETSLNDIIRFARKCGAEEVLKLAQMYVDESDVSKKIAMLNVFSHRADGFPLSPEYLIIDAKSDDEDLSNAAFEALEKTHHNTVREFALELAHDDSRKAEAISLLSANYRKSDRKLLTDLVKSLIIDYNDESGWHGAFMSVQDIFKQSGARDLPKDLLLYIYENTLCSSCREYVLLEMGRRRMVTEELLNECLYDSNYNIRNYAAKRLKLIK